MAKPTDKDDALLLDELINGPPSSSLAATASDGDGGRTAGAPGGFSAQWSALLATTKQGLQEAEQIRVYSLMSYDRRRSPLG